MRVLILLVALLSIGASVPVEEVQLGEELQLANDGPSSRLTSGLITQLLEALRELMINGSDAIPVLDPFVLEAMAVDGEIVNFPGSHVSVENLVLTGASTFEVDALTVSGTGVIRPMSVHFDVKIPAIDVTLEKYDLYVSVFGGEVFGNGDLSVQIVNGRGHGFVDVRVSLIGGQATLTNARITIGLDSLKIIINGLFGDEGSSAFVSTFLSNLIPTLLEFFEAEITTILSTAVVTYGNQILQDINIYEILG